ncbi:MAG: GMC oxidoreductase [Xanthobacteraceae bacterium]|jgi:5-(hydroxymethyl)furfural/furfural oxidase
MADAGIIVVGAGSAGAALAARLSEEKKLRVVLVEAGQDTAPGAVPDDIRDIFPSAFANRDYFWPDLTASMTDGDKPRPFPQARVMGGGSSVMGMIALRGLPSDYDGWEAMGARNWGWRDVLPYFRGLTCDLDRPAAERNAQAPNIVHRLPREKWPLYMRRIEAALLARGIASHPDINETSADGFFATPLSQDSERATSARCYLTSEARARPNLEIRTNTRVRNLQLESNRVCGVVAERDGKTEVLPASEVVLCAGAINSAAILLRSGIGPADELQRLGITPVADRPGVGRNYQNHSLLHFAMTLDESSRLAHGDRHYTLTSLRFSSGLEGCPAGDLFLYFVGRVSNRPFGTRMGMIAAALYAPFSRGAVTLQSPVPDVPPRISQRLLSDPRDAQRMVIATRFAEDLIVDQTVRGCFEEAYLLPRDPPLRLVNGTGALGTIKALAATAVLGSPASLRRAVLARAIQPGRLVADRNSHQPLSDAEILAASGTMFHPSCTCAIGAEDDRMAVVDPECRVYGVAGLRVADASVMPRVPSANTNIPTLMIAERVADFIRAGLRSM